MDAELIGRIDRLSGLRMDPRASSAASKHPSASYFSDDPVALLQGSASDAAVRALEGRGRWREGEMQALQLAVTQQLQEGGTVDWLSVQRKVAAVGARRSAAECLIQWRNVQDPAINNGPWTKHEALQLMETARRCGEHDWVEISEQLGTGRTPLQCLKHYQQTLNPALVRQEWTQAEDERLAEAVRLYGTKNWQLVADALPGRAAQQCALRWSKSASANRAIRTGRWTEAEERRLYLAVVALDMDNSSWREVAELVPGRDHSRCREKWVNVMDPSLSRRPFTAVEDNKLLRLVAELGPGQWAQVAKEMPGRTDNMCFRRWKALVGHDAERHVQHSRKRRKALPSQHGRKQERTVVEAEDIDVSLTTHLP